MIPQFIIALLPVRDGKFNLRLKNHPGETISMDNISSIEKICVGGNWKYGSNVPALFNKNSCSS